jgi:hypothetical protein
MSDIDDLKFLLFFSIPTLLFWTWTIVHSPKDNPHLCMNRLGLTLLIIYSFLIWTEKTVQPHQKEYRVLTTFWILWFVHAVTLELLRLRKIRFVFV